MGLSVEQRVNAVRKLKDDFELYARLNLKIKTKQGTIEPLIFNEPQKYIHSKLQEQLNKIGKIRAILLKGRQQGASTYTEGRLYWRTSMAFGKQAYILTHEQAATDNLFGMAKRYHDNCDPEVKPETGAANAKELSFTKLDSGYKVGTAGSKAVGRSGTLQLFHGSEIAFWPNAEDHFSGVMQCIPDEPGTEVIIESTANGVGGKFHDLWTKAINGESEYIAIFVPWFWSPEYRKEAPLNFKPTKEEQAKKALYHVDNDQLNWRRSKVEEMGQDLCDQEYPYCWQDAFLFSGRTKFEREHVDKAMKECCEPDYVMTLESKKFVKHAEGELKVWAEPKHGCRYVIGADVAEGIEEKENGKPGDYSCADVLEHPTGKQVAQWHGHIAPELYGDVLNYLGRHYNMAFIGVEANNHGLTTNVRLRNLEYQNLYLQKKIDDGRSGTVANSSLIGWLTTSKSKPYIIDELAAEIREGTHGIACKETVQELMTYVVDAKGGTNAQVGCYDDRVMSRAIAGEMLRQCPAYDMVINHSWWKLWDKDKKIPVCKHQFVSLKISFESIDDNKIAYSAYTRWGIFENEMTGDDCIIALGLWTKRAQYDEIRDIIKGLNTKHDPDLFLINRKQSGDSLFKDLKKAMPGKIRNTGTAKADDELTQAHSISTVFKAGQVFIPDGKEWALSMIDYVSQYPNCNDIGVSIMNTVTQALIYLRSGSWFGAHPKDKDDLPATFERVLSDSEQEDLDDTQDTRIIYYG